MSIPQNAKLSRRTPMYASNYYVQAAELREIYDVVDKSIKKQVLKKCI